jgi:hypothetical protein
MQASVSPSEQPKVNTTASEYYVLQYSVRFAMFKLCSSCLDNCGDADPMASQINFVSFANYQMLDRHDCSVATRSTFRTSWRSGVPTETATWPPSRSG